MLYISIYAYNNSFRNTSKDNMPNDKIPKAFSSEKNNAFAKLCRHSEMDSITSFSNEAAALSVLNVVINAFILFDSALILRIFAIVIIYDSSAFRNLK